MYDEFVDAADETPALAIVNATMYGLAASVFTQDLERRSWCARRLEAGMAHVNDSLVNDVAACPFGGMKNSGLGRYNGEWSIEEFTEVQWNSLQQAPRAYPF